ncbi:MAG: hypothetical protein P8Z72_13760 [Gammaproteobacteria bacterium]
MPEWSSYKLGEHSNDIAIDTSEDNQAAAVHLVNQGDRSLNNIVLDLDSHGVEI